MNGLSGRHLTRCGIPKREWNAMPSPDPESEIAAVRGLVARSPPGNLSRGECRSIRSGPWQGRLLDGVPPATLELLIEQLGQMGCARPHCLRDPGQHLLHDGALLERLGRRKPLMKDRPAGRRLELSCREKTDRPHRCRKGAAVSEIVVGRQSRISSTTALFPCMQWL